MPARPGRSRWEGRRGDLACGVAAGAACGCGPADRPYPRRRPRRDHRRRRSAPGDVGLLAPHQDQRAARGARWQRPHLRQRPARPPVRDRRRDRAHVSRPSRVAAAPQDRAGTGFGLRELRVSSGLRGERHLLHGAHRVRRSDPANPRAGDLYDDRPPRDPHRVDRGRSRSEQLRRNLARADPDRVPPSVPQPRRDRVRPKRIAERSRVRAPLHRRRGLRVHCDQRARTAATSGHAAGRDPADRSPGRERHAVLLRHPGQQPLRGRRRSVDSRRDLRTRLPQRAPHHLERRSSQHDLRE